MPFGHLSVSSATKPCFKVCTAHVLFPAMGSYPFLGNPWANPSFCSFFFPLPLPLDKCPFLPWVSSGLAGHAYEVCIQE